MEEYIYNTFVMGIYLPMVQLCSENVLEVVWNSVVLGISVFVGVS